MTKTYPMTLAPCHQSKQAQKPLRAYRTYRTYEKLLGHLKVEIKACVNQFKVRKTRSEN